MKMTLRIGLGAVLLMAVLGAKDSHTVRLTRPWSQLNGLSNAQKAKLSEIHRQARQEIQKILRHERRDCLAVLAQGQLDQLKTIEEQKTVDRKLATTQPAGEEQ
jgi:Spy/CpxP family protein refolding chaperone